MSLEELTDVKYVQMEVENRFEQQWLDSANKAYQKKYDLPHPYNLVRNRNELYKSVHLIRLENGQHLRYPVQWEVSIE